MFLKKPELSRKEIKKNHKLRMKTRPGARIGSKNPRIRVQNAPKHKRTFSVQEPIWHFWSAERHFKKVEFPPFGLWPNALQVTISSPFLIFLQKDESRFTLYTSKLFSRVFYLIIQRFFFYALIGIHFEALKLLIFTNPL